MYQRNLDIQKFNNFINNIYLKKTLDEIINNLEPKYKKYNHKIQSGETFVNILENAIKYSIKAPVIDVFTESSEKYLTIKIKDQGIGMNKSAQKQAFDKFYREQKGNVHDVKGHGLGLSYVKEIVSQHEGTVDVESVKGKGSTFIVKLPLVSLKNKRNE